jgi:hypothetical protein
MRKKSNAIYRLRAKATEDQYLSRIIAEPVQGGGHSITATFTEKGQEFSTKSQALKRAAHYTFSSTDERSLNKPWPKLEVVTIVQYISNVEDDSNCDLTHASKFIRKADIHFGSLEQFILKTAAQGKHFKYIVWAKGSHPIPEAASSHIVRNATTTRFDRYSPGETIIGIVNDTDLIYIKMHIDPEHIVGIWDYEKCKPISLSDLIKVY